MEEYRSKYLTIKNDLGLEGTFSTLGAGVKNLSLNGEPLILELASDEVYLSSNQFFGKTLGRVAGRMPDTFELNGKTYHLPGDDQHICLHGGCYAGLSYREFEGKTEEDKEGQSVVFHYRSEDGEAGYPGNLDVTVRYLICKNSNDLIITYRAVSDQDTYLNLSTHIYWNFQRSKDINDYKFQVRASKIGEFKKGTQLIVGEKSVPACLDFRKLTTLKDKLDAIKKDIPEVGTIDHTYILDDVPDDEPDVVLENDKLRLETYTDFDSVNFYVDSSLNPWDFANREDIHASERRAIAIEPQGIPLLENIFLKAGEVYSHEIIFKLMNK